MLEECLECSKEEMKRRTDLFWSKHSKVCVAVGVRPAVVTQASTLLVHGAATLVLVLLAVQDISNKGFLRRHDVSLRDRRRQLAVKRSIDSELKARKLFSVTSSGAAGSAQTQIDVPSRVTCTQRHVLGGMYSAYQTQGPICGSLKEGGPTASRVQALSENVDSGGVVFSIAALRATLCSQRFCMICSANSHCLLVRTCGARQAATIRPLDRKLPCCEHDLGTCLVQRLVVLVFLAPNIRAEPFMLRR